MTKSHITQLAATMLVLAALACGFPPPPIRDSTPTASAYAPTSSSATATPVETPTAPSTKTPTATPTEPTPEHWLPENTLALVSAGPWERSQLHALTIDGTLIDLGHPLTPEATVAPSGRWIGSTRSDPPRVVVTNLSDGSSYTINGTADSQIYGMAFDRPETRLAFLELGPVSEEGIPWAIVVVDLVDGTTSRFSLEIDIADPSMLPGHPLGWSADGSVLLIDTFMPYTEGAWAGVWALTLPPGTASTPIDSLGRRELIPMGGYLTQPRLSPDGRSLLYLNRDYDYTPAGYEPTAYDLAVNQLWQADIASGARTLLVETTDGSALGRSASWAPAGQRVIYAQGRYAGDTFASLTLKRQHPDGMRSDVGPIPLPPQGNLTQLDWCRPDVALITVTTMEGDRKLHRADLGGEATRLSIDDQHIAVLTCIQGNS